MNVRRTGGVIIFTLIFAAMLLSFYNDRTVALFVLSELMLISAVKAAFAAQEGEVETFKQYRNLASGILLLDAAVFVIFSV